MKLRCAVIILLFLTANRRADAEILFNKLDVVAKLDARGGLEVEETHELELSRDIEYFLRDVPGGADQKVTVHAVSRVESDGSRISLANSPDKRADCYQAYQWGLQIYIRGEKDAPFADGTHRRYLITYAIDGALTPSWDIASGPGPFSADNVPLNPWTRAKQVVAAWREVWPDFERTYRYDHDVAFPSINSGGRLGELNYRLEWDTSVWSLQGPSQPIGVATPEVNYRVQRVLRYLKDGRPAGVNFSNAASRIALLFGPFAFGLVAALCFVFAGRVLSRSADREVFERRIGGLHPSLVAAAAGSTEGRPSFGAAMSWLAARKKVAITVETPASGDNPAVIQLRLTTDRARLPPFEREVVDGVFGSGRDTISSADVRKRAGKREYDPDVEIGTAFRHALSTQPPAKKRYALYGAHLVLIWTGVAFLIKSLTERTSPDPFEIVTAVFPNYIAANVWPTGTRASRPTLLFLVIAVIVLGALAGMVALYPNKPVSALGSQGALLVGCGFILKYFSRLPKPSQSDLEFEAAVRWGLSELKRPRPALLDTWIDSIEASGLKRALDRWRSRYGGGNVREATDWTEMPSPDMASGPAFTGEKLRAANLPDDWEEAFYVYGESD